MDSEGGYFAPSPWTSSSVRPHDVDASTSLPSDDPVPPRKLTSKQEERLRSYLDDQFITISRGVAKRYVKSAPVVPPPQF